RVEREREHDLRAARLARRPIRARRSRRAPHDSLRRVAERDDCPRPERPPQRVARPRAGTEPPTERAYRQPRGNRGAARVVRERRARRRGRGGELLLMGKASRAKAQRRLVPSPAGGPGQSGLRPDPRGRPRRALLTPARTLVFGLAIALVVAG